MKSEKLKQENVAGRREQESEAERALYETDERPPFGRSWGLLYGLVLGNLAVLILLFYLFTKAFQ